MVKRVKLNTAPVLFSIIGISSHENDYRLSWSINEHLGFSFMQCTGIVTGEKNEFTCFVHEDDQQKLLLVSNRCDNGFLLEKYKNFDFILKFDTEISETKIAAWLRNLRRVPLVSAVVPIPVTKKVLQLLG